MADRKKTLVIGLGYFVRELVTEIIKSRPCIAVDSDENLKDLWAGNDDVTVFIGDANSIVLWKKLPLSEISHIVYFLADQDVGEELCRIARETFKLDIPIIAISHKIKAAEFYEKYNIVSLDPVAVGVSAITVLLEKNYATPSNIGLGKGEIAEVTIVRRSHLVDRKLRYMESSRWKVAAIYREGELNLPDGDSELRLGDKVVLVGEPGLLKNVVNILMQGIPQFPLQYGQYINIAVEEYPVPPMEEANYLRRLTLAKGLNCFGETHNIGTAQANEIIKSMNPKFMPPVKNYKDSEIFKDAGIVVVPTPMSYWLNFRIRYFMRNSYVPVLLAKGVFPYSCIIISLNSIFPSQVLQVSLELSRLSGLPLKAVYVTAPKSLRNAKLEADLADRQRIIRDYENIERVKLEHTVREGNPVKEFLDYQKDYPKSLVVIDNNPQNRITPFEPHIPFLLGERLNCSVLVLPAISE